MTARTKALVIGGRTFQIGKLSLGPIRQNPEAFKPMNTMGKTKELDLVTTVLVVFSSIDQAQTPIVEKDFHALIDGLDYNTGLDELTSAFVVAMQGTEKTEDGAEGEAKAETVSTA